MSYYEHTLELIDPNEDPEHPTVDVHIRQPHADTIEIEMNGAIITIEFEYREVALTAVSNGTTVIRPTALVKFDLPDD